MEVRILNGDGGSWIKKVKDRDTIFQLDPFHKNKAVRELIHEKQAQKDILELLSKKDISGVLHTLKHIVIVYQMTKILKMYRH